MITLFSGIPGSGKSYKMVAELSRVKDKFFVVHNIDGLKEGFLGDFGLNFVEYCKSEKGFFDPTQEKEKMEVLDFFAKEFQIDFCRKVEEIYNRPVLVIIDEAQEWLSRVSKPVMLWLSYHRHLVQEVWLVAHRAANIPSVYRSFIEVEFRAKSGSIIGIPGFFLYNRIVGGSRAGYVKERKVQEIFNIYKSQSLDIERKRKIPMMFPLVVVGVVLGIAAFFYLPTRFLHGSTKKVDPVVSAVKVAESNQLKGGAVVSPSNVGVVGLVRPGQVLSEMYAFVGNFNGRAILENRRTGQQLQLERVPGSLVLLELRGSDSASVWCPDTRSVVVFHNSERYVAGGALRGTSTETPAFGGGAVGG